MNIPRFEINLMKDGIFFKSYDSDIIPMVGDMIHIKEYDIFIIESRLLPMTTANKVVLFGKTAKTEFYVKSEKTE